MAKVLIIPDVHLKPWMFKQCESILAQADFDHIVCLGDIVDDWGQQYNQSLYIETIEALVSFAKKHQNFFFCYGNHDMSYFWRRHEYGYSPVMEPVVTRELAKLRLVLPEENIGFIHHIDNVLFSHAGLTEYYVDEYLPETVTDIDDIIECINGFGAEELWTDVSPLWARPQNGILSMYAPEYMQVVGHTPVHEPEELGSLLTLDTFSTYSDGRPFGDGRFVYIDTVQKTWQYV